MDSDAVVAAMRSPSGASAAILRAVRRKRATLMLSVPLALEYEATCNRNEHRLASGLSEEQINVFIDGVIAMTQPVETHFLWRPQLRDPGDEMVLEAGVNGHADILVTFNLRHFGSVPVLFGIEALFPRDALGKIR